jgi:high frequency lysogenization protein
MKDLHDQTLALAALYQAIQTIDMLARTGSAPEHDMQVCIDSLFIYDAPTTESVYGSIVELKTGLTGLVKQLNGESYLTESTDEETKTFQKTNISLAQYAIGVMHLQKKLAKKPDILEKVTTRLEVAKKQSELFSSSTHENVLANIADIYSESVSTLAAKIMVQGEQNHLSNPLIVNKIRSLLLAAVRAAILWNQIGGRRWHIIFRRNKILKMANIILKDEIPQQLN